MSEAEDRLERDVKRASDAKRLLADPLLAEAFASIEREATAALAQSAVQSTPEHLRSVALVLHVTNKVRRCLEKHVADGNAARAMIHELIATDEAKRKKAKRRA